MRRYSVLLTATPKEDTLKQYGTRCNGPHGLYLAPFHCYTQRDAISRNDTFSPLERYESAVPTVPVDNVRLLDTRGGAEQEARDICEHKFIKKVRTHISAKASTKLLAGAVASQGLHPLRRAQRPWQRKRWIQHPLRSSCAYNTRNNQSTRPCAA